jgi:hypothetical protein
MRWSACKDMSLGAQDCPLWEDVTKQHSEDLTENIKSLCDSDL